MGQSDRRVGGASVLASRLECEDDDEDEGDPKDTRLLTRDVNRAKIALSLMGAYWFRPDEYAGGGMPRTMRWTR